MGKFKYIRKVRTKSGKWRYIYSDSYGHTISTGENPEAGTVNTQNPRVKRTKRDNDSTAKHRTGEYRSAVKDGGKSNAGHGHSHGGSAHSSSVASGNSLGGGINQPYYVPYMTPYEFNAIGTYNASLHNRPHKSSVNKLIQAFGKKSVSTISSLSSKGLKWIQSRFKS